VLDVVNGRRRRIRGCYPSFLATGQLATRDGSGPRVSVLQNGHVAFEGEDLAAALGERDVSTRQTRIMGTGAATDGSLLVAVLGSGTGFARSASLQRWRDGRLEQSLAIPAVYLPAVLFFGFRIDVSPNGTEAAFVFPERSSLATVEDLAALVDLRSGRVERQLSEEPYAALAWSPDGGWLAVAGDREIRVYGSDRSTPAYVLPVAAQALAWAS
jgi:hypothetical protein